MWYESLCVAMSATVQCGPKKPVSGRTQSQQASTRVSVRGTAVSALTAQVEVVAGVRHDDGDAEHGEGGQVAAHGPLAQREPHAVAGVQAGHAGRGVHGRVHHHLCAPQGEETDRHT